MRKTKENASRRLTPAPESISRAERRWSGEVQEHLLSSLLIPPAPGLHRAGGTSSPNFGVRDDIAAAYPSSASAMTLAHLDEVQSAGLPH